MAFHVACPITCRKICFCAHGFPRRLQSDKGKNDFLKEVARVEQFLIDPWLIKAREDATIQVKVPKVILTPAQPLQALPTPGVGDGCEDVEDVGERAAAASAKMKRVALQKQAAAASIVAEDYARRFEAGDADSMKDVSGEEKGQSNAKLMCRLCFCGENEVSEKTRKMLSCNSCGKKYHRSCLKSWSQNRDLFHWSSWKCPSCRTCEACRRTGDPNKFMFCKRCDGAYHCYCQQPPHKNVGHGPYLCPKHTKCYSCGSSVPGNGLSVRWFLGYTCCDACGRLFVKGNYCPVCLKVYRDSESTPMVCCDICQRWVHCPCDGISDAKYMQFQVDGNLQYVCSMCRGECCQVRNLEEAVQELWRRRDEAERDLIISLRAAVGLPTQEEIFDISPFSDDEESGSLVLKNDYSRSLKFSLKGIGDKSPKKNKEYGKRTSNKKYGKKKAIEASFISGTDTPQSVVERRDGDEEIEYHGPIAVNSTEGRGSVKDTTVSIHKVVDEATATNENKTSRTIKIKSKPHDLTNKEGLINDNATTKIAQGPKLVIHLGGRSRNKNSPSRSESSTVKRAQDPTLTAGQNRTDQMKGSKFQEKDGHLIKIKHAYSGSLSNSPKLSGGESTDLYESVSPINKYSDLGKRPTEDIASVRTGSDVPDSKKSKYSSNKYSDEHPVSGDLNDGYSRITPVSKASTVDHKPYLKFKIPNSLNNGNQTLLPLPGKDEITYTRGQRSKRKRPAQGDEDTPQCIEGNTMKEFTDANWVLQKLGKDAAGKRVEVHQSTTNSWHRGTVVEVFEGTSTVSISLDDGKPRKFELGRKQGIRFVSQKHKR